MYRMAISLIVASTKSGVIAVDGKLPWKCPADMKHFKEMTSGHNVVMGRKTWDSLGHNPLFNRNNFIITRNIDNFKISALYLTSNNCDTRYFIDYSIDEAITRTSMFPSKDVFIIGGADIYHQCLRQNIIDKIYLSIISDDLIVPYNKNSEIKEFNISQYPEWNRTKMKNREGFRLLVFEKGITRNE